MQKILIIRLSSYGDVVLTTPVIRCLKQQFKGGVEIHYLIKRKFSDVIKANPYISKLHFWDNPGNNISSVFRLPSSVLSENFNYIIDLHHNFRSFLVKQKLGVRSFSVNKINIQKWLRVNFKWNLLPKTHIVDRYLETVKSFGIENDGLGLDYFIPSEDEISVSSLPLAYHKGYIAFVIGGNYFTKKLPVEKIISICKKIHQPVILLGGKEDFEKGEKIAQIANLCYNACGQYNINQSASLIKQAKNVITHDTGLMHIAAAFKKKIISVWGNTIPEFGMEPYFGKFQISNFKFQILNLPCRPCSKLGFRKCPQKHFNCMNMINEDAIADYALKSFSS